MPTLRDRVVGSRLHITAFTRTPSPFLFRRFYVKNSFVALAVSVSPTDGKVYKPPVGETMRHKILYYFNISYSANIYLKREG